MFKFFQVEKKKLQFFTRVTVTFTFTTFVRFDFKESDLSAGTSSKTARALLVCSLSVDYFSYDIYNRTHVLVALYLLKTLWSDKNWFQEVKTTITGASVRKILRDF